MVIVRVAVTMIVIVRAMVMLKDGGRDLQTVVIVIIAARRTMIMLKGQVLLLYQY